MRISRHLLFTFLVFLSTCKLWGQYRASEWEDRDRWQKAEQIIEHMQLDKGMAVADLGCHEGYLTMKLAPVVGPEGRVYAVDVGKSKLDKLESRLKKQRIENVQTVLGSYDDPKLPMNSMDAVVILDAYHEMDHYREILAHLFRALKPGGRLVLVEPIAKEREDWSRDKQAGKHEISMRFALADLTEAGFNIQKKQDPFIDRPSKSDRMWMAVAVKPKN